MWRWRQGLEGCGHKPRNIWGHQKLEETRKDSFLEPSEGTSLLTPWFSASGLRTVRESVSIVLSHLVCGTLLWQPQETICLICLSSCVCVCSVAQLCTALCDPMDCSPPGSPVHGILQAKILEWVAMPFSRTSSQSRDQIQVSCKFFTIWATREDSKKYTLLYIK